MLSLRGAVQRQSRQTKVLLDLGDGEVKQMMAEVADRELCSRQQRNLGVTGRTREIMSLEDDKLLLKTSFEKKKGFR